MNEQTSGDQASTLVVRKTNWWLGVALFVWGVNLGWFVQEHHGTQPPQQYASTSQRLLTPTDFMKESGRFAITPGDILIHIVPESSIPTICQDPNAYACTYTSRTPCAIYFPAGQGILYWPQDEVAIWGEYYNNETLAHEILHCFLPNWHDPWTAAHTKPHEQTK